MSLTLEWRRRIERWLNALPRHFYQPLLPVEWRGFTTPDQLTPAQASQRALQSFPSGTAWGAKWEYGWFHTSFKLPPEAAGKRIALRPDVGGEGVVFVNQHTAGARDREHKEITLAMQATAGAEFDVWVESYAGHGLAPEGGGPVSHGTESVPEPGPTQVIVGGSSLGIWHEDVYQLWIDVKTLYEIRNGMDENSLRVSEIDEGLRKFTLLVDFEIPPEQMLDTVRQARQLLKPLMECTNGSSAPLLYTFGHAHLDVAWLWPLAETERKIGRTTSSQLALMKEYPEYRYLQSQPHLLCMLRQRYPDLYEQVKAASNNGQYITEGGMWVEADTNLAGGESLIRQFMYGKRFFKEEFGTDSELLWLPDVFGYSGALPQIMSGCGIKYFATSKIFWTYNGGDPFPYNLFTWEGIDGSTVLAHIFNDYGSETRPEALNRRWNERVQKDGLSSLIVAFGHGDGGGGPTRDHLEFLRRAKNLEGVPRTLMASPIDFFKDAEVKGIPSARYVGELYFQAHRGTYTSQARTKKNTRKVEFALREAEFWGAAAASLGKFQFPGQLMLDNWQTVLLLQFHDILPGSSIRRVYQEAEAMHGGVIRSAQAIAEAARQSIGGQTNGLTIFNSLSWERKALVELPAGCGAIADSSGKALLTQTEDGKTLSEVTVPSCGWTTVYPKPAGAQVDPDLSAKALHASVNRLENEFLRLELNASGEITSIFDKEGNREIAAGPCNSFKLYKDVPGWFDAWDIDSMYEDCPLEIDPKATLELVAEGPLVAVLRLTRKINSSTLQQEISLRRGSRMVEFDTRVDWQESHKLLKVAFPVNLHANEALHEIQFGHISRPNHRSRPFDANRFEVSNHKWSALVEATHGFAILNDCKYGLNVLDNSINLTLLKSALSPDMTADKGQQTFKYAIYAWNGSMADSDLLENAYALNCPVTVQAGDAREQSLFKVDQPNIVIETVKLAEDGSGDVIMRLYESLRAATQVKLSTALPLLSIQQTDMLENAIQELAVGEGFVQLSFRPFEVKTLRLKLQK
jgi:alpha-mannosidase